MKFSAGGLSKLVQRRRGDLNRELQLCSALARGRRMELSLRWSCSIMARGSSVEACACIVAMMLGRVIALALLFAYRVASSLAVLAFPLLPLFSILAIARGARWIMEKLGAISNGAHSRPPPKAWKGASQAAFNVLRTLDAAVEVALWNLPPLSWLPAWEDAACLSLALRPGQPFLGSAWARALGLNPYALGAIPSVACLHSPAARRLGPWHMPGDMELAKHCHAPVGIYGAMRHFVSARARPRDLMGAAFDRKRCLFGGNPFNLGLEHLQADQDWLGRVDAAGQAREISAHAPEAGRMGGSAPRRRL